MIYIKKRYIDFLDKNGQNHRINGPSYIGQFNQSWHKNGRFHRLDGPAYINNNVRYWYIEGEEYTETEYLAKQEQYYKKLKEMGLSHDTYQ